MFILLVANFYFAPGSFIAMQEFSSKTTCEAAARVLLDHQAQSSGARSTILIRCVPK